MENIGDLEEKINHEPLSRLVDELGCRVRYSEVPSFIMGYCASDDETFEKVAEYIREQIGIFPNSVLSLEVDPETRSLISSFFDNLGNISQLDGQVVMVKAKGFERLRALKDDFIQHRVAHDYDQNVVQNEARILRNSGKKVLVVTQIGRSLGDGIYNLGVTSACQSQFKSFLYELGK